MRAMEQSGGYLKALQQKLTDLSRNNDHSTRADLDILKKGEGVEPSSHHLRGMGACSPERNFWN